MKSNHGYDNLVASVTQLYHGHSIIYMRNVSSLLMSKILIPCNTLDMQVHTMNLNIKAISALNPGQTPVDVTDCPVYALTKETQFRFPEHFSNYFAMFRGLHIEQCLLVTHGQFIEGSGLREILEACSLATIRVGALIDVNQIKQARYCVQVTLCSLHRKSVDGVKADDSTFHPYK